MPRSFTVFGQKFVIDSWALSQITFDSIRWEPDDGVNVIFGKVIRRKPSCLDVAFSVFGNDQIVPELTVRMTATKGVQFRDGLPYQHNLAAVRNVIDSQSRLAWTNSIYSAWLAALRELSAPTAGPRYPEAMRTRASAMKTLNTQLASWTELRHDTVLYAKESYSGIFLCSYPAGFVEPLPQFWGRMRALASFTADAVARLPVGGRIGLPARDPSDPFLRWYDLSAVKAGQEAFLRGFADRMGTLQGIAEKELAQQPLTAVETDYLKDLIELHKDYFGPRQFNGWYPNLFYRNVFQEVPFGQDQGSDKWDAMAVDVHTDPPDAFVGDPGAVIHEGIGHVHLLMIAVDSGPDRTVYAGPVLSHYEFEVPGVTRMSDAEWKSNLKAGNKPRSPEWTRSYLVPGPFAVPPGYE